VLIQFPPIDDIERDFEATLFATVDGIHCRINEPRTDPGSKWYSHKFHGPGVTYEVGISLVEGRILWISDSYPAGESDINVFRKPGGIMEKIPPGKKVIADKGYRGEHDKISTPNHHDSLNAKMFKKRALARHETLNKRLNDFKILSERYCHGFPTHKVAFPAVCVLVQNDLNASPLFDF
jgi:DDE superfamily endonuclease